MASASRTHHPLKTFYRALGWTDKQFPDGRPANNTAPTASPKNAANDFNSNNEPGSPPTTNRHPSDRH
jgi:hypothetical protein